MTAADFRKLADAATPGPWCFERDTNLEALIVFNGMVVAEEIRRDENANFIAACGTERQRIHRALLLLEGVEKLHQAVTMTDGEQRIAVCTHCCELDYQTSSHCADKHQHGPGKPICATAALLDAASKETGTRP